MHADRQDQGKSINLPFSESSLMSSNDQNCNFDLLEWMLEKHGPLIGGNDLYAALGYRTYAAFHRARTSGDIQIEIFSIEGRRGLFAMTADVAIWLKKQLTIHKQKEGVMDS